MPRQEIQTDEHGFPVYRDFVEHDVERQVELIPHQTVAASRKKWFHARWVRSSLFLAFMACVVCFGFGKQIRPWFSSEMAHFFARRAVEKDIANDISGALADADHACRWEPDELVYLKMRGHYHLKNGDPQAAYDDFDRIIQKRPRDAEGYSLRAFALARLGRFEEAIDDATTALEKTGPHDAEALNSRAYLCALGNTQLEQGLADITQAIEMGLQNRGGGFRGLQPGEQAIAAHLDTRGYLHLLLGNLDESQADLDRAIALTQLEQSELERYRNARFVDPRELQYRLRMMDEHLAVMHYHRGELYEAQGRAAEARQEKQLGVRLGYDPERGVY